ncbi:hypothetical protein M917_1759 [Psychrobacter aquaticus CMS 56]|uniref:Uncharacterized protein n=1 Tax=Psychrobacter aquaticus CMS 56 TaxID=1354303 RepID=U4T312_9GAMM|nr:hypothetical protein M917_1759 [Psychrobacter aquaticus CMS 56]
MTDNDTTLTHHCMTTTLLDNYSLFNDWLSDGLLVSAVEQVWVI